MATLVLSVVGSVIGGPVGAIVGSFIGQQIDQQLFGPKGREGPRLANLAVQSSSYGEPLPRFYGRARASGTVIWATDLVETRSRTRAGKGQPRQTVYSYSANFAVALGSRRISRIGRIWADGNLLRGEAGDFKTPATMRFYSGDEDQARDPLIASAEGESETPAYRGLAYAVFENFQLGEYGNRIPSLSFEIIADDGSVSLDTVLTDLLNGDAITDCPSIVDGLIAAGGSARDLLDNLAPVFPVTGSIVENTLSLAEAPRPAPSPDGLDFGAANDDRRVPRLETARSGSGLAATAISLSYFDPARDYQPGLQRAWRSNPDGREVRFGLPLTLSADAARQLVEHALARMEAARATAKLSLPWRHAGLQPGRWISLPGQPGRWRIDASAFEDMVVRLTLSRLAPGQAVILPAEAGRPLLQSDTVAGTTVLHLLDVPWLGDGTIQAPTLLVAARGSVEGWRRAALSLSTDGGATFSDAGFTTGVAIAGSVLVPPVAGPAWIVDAQASLEVLLPSWQTLVSQARDAVLAGANLALVGDELLAFESAEPLGGGRYRLRGLLRGLRGTEWAIATHSVGERFIVIDRDDVTPITLPLGVSSASIMAIGVGDTVPVTASVSSAAAALVPPSPVHLRALLRSDGGYDLRWLRRSRNGWSWPDLVDAPLAEESERYLITTRPVGRAARSVEVVSNAWTYDASQRTADSAAGAAAVAIEVRQMGTFGPSRAASLTLSLV